MNTHTLCSSKDINHIQLDRFRLTLICLSVGVNVPACTIDTLSI